MNYNVAYTVNVDCFAYINHVNIFAYKKKGEINIMSTKVYMTAQDIASLLGVSVGFAYKLIREMNQELKQRNFLVVSGRVPTRFVEEKYYGLREITDGERRVAK